MDALVLGVLVLVLAAEFVNGWTDAPNSIATVVSTRVLTPSQALGMASKGFVLANGENRFTGSGRELLENPEVAQAFLGG